LKLLRQSCKDLQSRKKKIQFLEERALLIKDLQRVARFEIIAKEEIISVAKTSGVEIKVEELQIKDPAFLDLDKNIKNQLNGIADNLFSCHDAMFPSRGERGIASRFFGLVAMPITMWLPNEKQQMNTSLSSINTSLRNLFKKTSGINGNEVKAEITKIDNELKMIGEMVKKRNNVELMESFRVNVVNGVDEFYEALAQREILTREQEGKSISFEIELRSAVEKNIVAHGVDITRIKRQRALKSGSEAEDLEGLESAKNRSVERADVASQRKERQQSAL
jgi:hypothetical protein